MRNQALRWGLCSSSSAPYPVISYWQRFIPSRVAPLRALNASCRKASQACSEGSQSTIPQRSPSSTTTAAQKSHTSFHVDPHRLPSTIPGITQAELAERITRYHTTKAESETKCAEEALSLRVEAMRRSLSPEDFDAFMKGMEATTNKAAIEAAKQASMSPAELHRYYQSKRRAQKRQEWAKSFMLITAIVGALFFLFFLFVFFES